MRGESIQRVGGCQRLVHARAEGLLAAPFDERTLTLTGQSVPVTLRGLTRTWKLADDGTRIVRNN